MNYVKALEFASKLVRYKTDVQHVIHQMSSILNERAVTHDQSAFNQMEMQNAFIAINAEGKNPIDTQQLLTTVQDIHFASNPHHPEYHENGVRDMSIFDILELMADWKITSRAKVNTTFDQYLNEQFAVYDVPEYVQSIIRQTAKQLNWDVKVPISVRHSDTPKEPKPKTYRCKLYQTPQGMNVKLKYPIKESLFSAISDVSTKVSEIQAIAHDMLNALYVDHGKHPEAFHTEVKDNVLIIEAVMEGAPFTFSDALRTYPMGMKTVSQIAVQTLITILENEAATMRSLQTDIDEVIETAQSKNRELVVYDGTPNIVVSFNHDLQSKAAAIQTSATLGTIAKNIIRTSLNKYGKYPKSFEIKKVDGIYRLFINLEEWSITYEEFAQREFSQSYTNLVDVLYNIIMGNDKELFSLPAPEGVNLITKSVNVFHAGTKYAVTIQHKPDDTMRTIAELITEELKHHNLHLTAVGYNKDQNLILTSPYKYHYVDGDTEYVDDMHYVLAEIDEPNQPYYIIDREDGSMLVVARFRDITNDSIYITKVHIAKNHPKDIAAISELLISVLKRECDSDLDISRTVDEDAFRFTPTPRPGPGGLYKSLWMLADHIRKQKCVN